MNRREAVTALGALALGACIDPSAPLPIMGKPTVSMGVSVFCGWANPRPEYGLVPGSQCPWKEPWKVMRTRDRVPLLGEYDEREPRITAERLRMMESAGVAFVSYQVEMRYGN